MLDRNEVLSMNILIAGGTGYIGSHICVELLESGHDVVVIDDFSNSKPDVLESIYKIVAHLRQLVKVFKSQLSIIQIT